MEDGGVVRDADEVARVVADGGTHLAAVASPNEVPERRELLRLRGDIFRNPLFLEFGDLVVAFHDQFLWANTRGGEIGPWFTKVS